MVNNSTTNTNLIQAMTTSSLNFIKPLPYLPLLKQTWINEKAAEADSDGLHSIWLRR
jgi:hypothetical protein